MNRYKLKDIYSLCNLFPNDFKVYNEGSEYIGIIYIPLNAAIIAFQQVSNKRYEIYSIIDCFVFYNDGISPRDSRMTPEITINYTLNNIPNKLSDYLKFFLDNYKQVEKAYKEYLLTQKLNKISEDFL